MSKSLCASFAVKKGVSYIVLVRDGFMVCKSVTQIKDESILDSSYSCLISSFISTLRIVRKFINENSDIDKVIFEVNNTAFIKWVYNGTSKEQYHNLFIEAMELLNEIPVQYSFTYNKKPLSLIYIKDKPDKVKLSGLLEE